MPGIENEPVLGRHLSVEEREINLLDAYKHYSFSVNDDFALVGEENDMCYEYSERPWLCMFICTNVEI